MQKSLHPSTSTFRTLIEGDYLYIDKTKYIYELVKRSAGVYFFSRPRRFGKSLFVSTLEDVFRGNRELFKGLWIDGSDYQWETHPVIRLDFSSNSIATAAELEQFIDYEFQRIARENGLTEPLLGYNYKSRFQDLIRQLAQTSQVVILVDEYDKPLTDNLENLEEAVRIRDVLRSFYSVIKALDQHIRFVFITGISKFSKVGVFSAMNNLDDMTMTPTFATAFGITEEELQTYFAPYITAFAEKENISESKLVDLVRIWYDGFCFVEECESVYNPFSTIQLFNKQRFANYWFDSGTPTFLVKLLRDQNYYIEAFEELVLPEVDFSTFELEHLDIVPLLFQTGYLTIKDYKKEIGEETIYSLSYPNREVERAFTTYLLSSFSYTERSLSRSHLYQLVEALQKHDIEQVFIILRTFFANVPYNIAIDKEAYYQTIFYIVFKMLGVQVDAEVVTNRGRIDAVVELDDHIFLFEFKLNGSAQEALNQIKEKEYVQKYSLVGKPLTCIGANFNTETRMVDDWQSDSLNPSSES